MSQEKILVLGAIPTHVLPQYLSSCYPNSEIHTLDIITYDSPLHISANLCELPQFQNKYNKIICDIAVLPHVLNNSNTNIYIDIIKSLLEKGGTFIFPATFFATVGCSINDMNNFYQVNNNYYALTHPPTTTNSGKPNLHYEHWCTCNNSNCLLYLGLFCKSKQKLKENYNMMESFQIVIPEVYPNKFNDTYDYIAEHKKHKMYREWYFNKYVNPLKLVLKTDEFHQCFLDQFTNMFEKVELVKKEYFNRGCCLTCILTNYL